MNFEVREVAGAGADYQALLLLREQVLREPLGLTLSDDDVEAEIARLLEERQAQDRAKRDAKIAAGESVPEAPPSPEDVEQQNSEKSAPPPPPPPPVRCF
jgi:two-component system chemotaxis sensor kinase CheA